MILIFPLDQCGPLTMSKSPFKFEISGLDVVLLQNVNAVGGMSWGYLD